VAGTGAPVAPTLTAMPPDDDEEDSLWVDSADRKVAMRALDEHRAEEHLTDNEHERRRGLAKQAQTRGDLRALFADLPAPHPLIGEPDVVGAARSGSGAGLLLTTGGVILLAAIVARWWVPALLFASLLVVATILVTVRRR
jgi:Flp pilus assembly protein TadB